MRSMVEGIPPLTLTNNNGDDRPDITQHIRRSYSHYLESSFPQHCVTPSITRSLPVRVVRSPIHFDRQSR